VDLNCLNYFNNESKQVKNSRYIVWLLFMSFSSSAATNEIEISTITQQVIIDGVLDDEVWDAATVQQLKYQVKPGSNVISDIDTDVMLAEDGENLYIAFRAYDADPSKIRAFLRNRDQGFDDDRVELSIDTFNNAQSAYRFSVNAVGVQIDEIRNEVNDEELLEWDVTWASAARITEFGYVVEMAIPYTVLSFPNNDVQQWRINLQRYYPRDQQYRLSLNPEDRNSSCKICQYSLTNNMTGINPPTKLTLTPSFIFHRSELIETGIQPNFEQTGKDLSFDLRWGITPNITMAATLNPNYSQVESDAATLEINQKFSTKQDEKRHFFVEGAEYFQTNLDLVHSRTITDPDYGFKVTAKTENNIFAASVAQDSQTNIVLPGSQGSDIERLGDGDSEVANLSAVLRYQHKMKNGLSIGSLFTHRQAQDVAYQNSVISFDSHWQMSDSDRLYLQAMHSNTVYPEYFQVEYQQAAKLNDNSYFAQYDHDTETWYHSFIYQNIGKDFRADSGFVTQANIENFHTKTGYQWYGEEHQWWSKIDWDMEWELTLDQNGQLLERIVESDVEIEGLWQSSLEVKLEAGDEVFNLVNYSVFAYKLEANIKPFSGIDMSAKFESGKKIDTDNERIADFFEYEFVSELNLGQHLLLDITLEYESLDVPEGNVFEAYTQDVRLSYQFTNNSSLALTYIVEDTNKNLALYNDSKGEAAHENETSHKLVYSYKLSPQTLFIAGYQQGKFRDDQTTPEQTDQRTAFMKISYAWMQ
jgi:hypothetical protein